MNTIIAFLIGLWIGAPIGIFTIALFWRRT